MYEGRAPRDAPEMSQGTEGRSVPLLLFLGHPVGQGVEERGEERGAVGALLAVPSRFAIWYIEILVFPQSPEVADGFKFQCHLVNYVERAQSSVSRADNQCLVSVQRYQMRRDASHLLQPPDQLEVGSTGAVGLYFAGLQSAGLAPDQNGVSPSTQGLCDVKLSRLVRVALEEGDRV